MNPSKRGLSTSAKAGAAVIVIIVVVGVLYFDPGVLKLGSSPTTNASGPVSALGGNGTQGLYSMVRAFSQMQLAVDINDPNNGVSNMTYSYTVLGNMNSGSTQFTRVEFVTVGAGNAVIIWFYANGNGSVGEVEVPQLGASGNFTRGQGPTNGLLNLPYYTTYANLFGVIPSLTDNATLFSTLTKYSEGAANVGPTQADVITYNLASHSATYSEITVKVATVAANNVKLVVYLYTKTHDGATQLIKVTSLKV